jgi:hypothetical protein
MKRTIPAQQRGMSEARGTHQYRDQESDESDGRVDVVG